MPKFHTSKYPSLRLVTGSATIVFADGFADVTDQKAAAYLRQFGGPDSRYGIVEVTDEPTDVPADTNDNADDQDADATEAGDDVPVSDLLTADQAPDEPAPAKPAAKTRARKTAAAK